MLRSDPAPLPPAPVLAALATFFAAADLAIPTVKLPSIAPAYALRSWFLNYLSSKTGRYSFQRLPLRTAIPPQNDELRVQLIRGHGDHRQEQREL